MSNELLIGIEKELLIKKAQKETLHTLGSSITKIKRINKSLHDYIISSLDWQRIFEKSINVTFAQLSNSLADLNKKDKELAVYLYESLNLDWLTELAKNSNDSILRDCLRKLRNISESRSRDIFQNVKIKSF